MALGKKQPKREVRNWGDRRGREVVDAWTAEKKMSRQETKEKVAKVVQVVKHPGKAAGKAAKSKATDLSSAAISKMSTAAKFKAFGTCETCLQPDTPSHRCRVSISFRDPEKARAEYEKLKKKYGR